MTLSLTPTLGVIVAIILVLLNVTFSFYPLFFFCFFVSDLSLIAGQLTPLIVNLQGALEAGSCFLETEWQMSRKVVATTHRFLGNCLRGRTLWLLSLYSFSFSIYDLFPSPQHLICHDDMYLSISFSLPHSVGVSETCIDCLARAILHGLRRKSKDGFDI